MIDILLTDILQYECSMLNIWHIADVYCFVVWWKCIEYTILNVELTCFIQTLYFATTLAQQNYWQEKENYWYFDYKTVINSHGLTVTHLIWQSIRRTTELQEDDFYFHPHPHYYNREHSYGERRDNCPQKYVDLFAGSALPETCQFLTLVIWLVTMEKIQIVFIIWSNHRLLL